MTGFSANSVAAGAVYIFGTCICLGCALMLIRGYLRSRMRLMLWSGLFFFALTADNVFLFLDLMIWPDVNLSLLRNGVTLCGLVLLIFGLIQESE